MGKQLSSPIFPIPSWYFTDILTSESRDVARIMWVFIQESLEDGHKDVPASFTDIEMWTGLVPDRISASIRTLREKGYLFRVKAGSLNSATGTREKSVYRVNWDFKEQGIEARVRQIYGHITKKYDIAESPNGESPIQQLDVNVAKLVKPGDKVRVGRFGADEETNTKKWFRVGYQPVREKLLEGPWGVMLRKMTDGQLDQMTSRDILSFWEYRYLKRYSSPYIPMMGKDLKIISRLRKVVSNSQIIRMIRWLFDSGQQDYSKPGLGLLGSRLVTDVNTKSIAWEKAVKSSGGKL
jgi:hypothetical protein